LRSAAERRILPARRPADLAVEIVPTESRLRDRGQKLAEYEMGGVREYWIIDPERRQAAFYVLCVFRRS
jgi:Uma2 family endonuclease